MNTIEEQLWSYIDGNCTAEERIEMEQKIATNLQYNAIYAELLAVHQELTKLDYDEPSLSFTRNVMEKVEIELPPVALKTKIDNRIIYGLGALFVLPLLAIFLYALFTSNWNFDLPKFAYTLDYKKIFTPVYVQLFILFDVALALVYLDRVWRKKLTKKEAS